MTQTFTQWNNDPRITEAFLGISVASLGDGTTVLLLSARDGFLRVTFRQILALMIHEEFAHPHVDADEALPDIAGGKGAYPLLVVQESDWTRSFSETRLFSRGMTPTHYQYISMSYFVDVLSYIPPTAQWVGPDAFDVLFGQVAP